MSAPDAARPTPGAPVDVAVLGAGPAGLLAALDLARAGRSVVVLEAADHVGGMAASIEVGGVRVDLGSHRLHPATDPALLAELRGVLGGDLQVRPRHGRIRLGGRWVGFPLRTGDLLRAVPPRLALRFALDAATGPLRSPRAPTFAEEVRAGLGPTALAELYGPYADKLWGTPADVLSGVLARRRISARGAGDIVRRLVRAARPEGRVFLYPRGGFGRISEALADAAVAAGAEVRLGATVGAVTLPANPASPVVVTLADATGAVVSPEVRARTVLSTLAPAALAAAVTGSPAAGEAPAALGQVQHRAMVLVYLVLDRRPYTDFDAHYLPGPGIVSRCSEPTRYRDDPDDPTDRTVLCAEVPCWATGEDPRWTATDEELADRVVDELVGLGLPDPRPVVEVATVRLPRVYPVVRAGEERALAEVAGWARSLEPRVVTFGRQGLVVGDNTHHVLAMGRAAAACVGADGVWDALGWQRSLEAFAAHVVED